MADQKKSGRKKGFFSQIGLPVARHYVYPKSQWNIYIIGGIGLLIVGGIFAVMAKSSPGSVVSNGPLSSSHASFSNDCSSCHSPMNGVTDANCADCHEKYGSELGIYSFDTHYLYRSKDISRIGATGNEEACFACHAEHEGQNASITQVSDSQCQTCHDVSSFNRDHPEFMAVSEQITDQANLIFPHTLHVNEIRSQENVADVEKTCLFCHNATNDGKHFEPINFEQHCDACHLSTRDATPFMNIENGPLRTSPGVASLRSIQNQQRPGTRWAFYLNPAEFNTRGNRLQKRPLYHEDPWVLENLRRLRQALYPSSGLPDLIQTTADVDSRTAEVLYEEAVQTLRLYIEELRNQPEKEVQDELRQAEELLQLVEQRLLTPYAPLDETQFLISAAELNPDFSAETVAEYNTVIDQLTEACQTCHIVEKATIKRVQADQRTMIRSEFNHRAHVIQTRCLDCHDAIPIREMAILDSIPPPELDRAAIHNMPSITNCQSCHAENQASNTCITCHQFHPDKSSHANLLPYVD